MGEVEGWGRGWRQRGQRGQWGQWEGEWMEEVGMREGEGEREDVERTPWQDERRNEAGLSTSSVLQRGNEGMRGRRDEGMRGGEERRGLEKTLSRPQWAISRNPDVVSGCPLLETSAACVCSIGPAS